MNNSAPTLSATLAGVALAALAVTGTTPAGGQPGGHNPFLAGRGCTFYEHAQLEGESRYVDEEDDVHWIGHEWNDRVSSLECDRQCSVTVYEHIGLSGDSSRFRGRDRFVGHRWNDRISSLRVTCGGDVRRRPVSDGARGSCTFFSDPGHRGARISVSQGDDGSWVGNRWNDRISSLTCRPGCSARLFEHVDYGGSSVDLVSADALHAAWNDRISSVRVVCHGR